MILNRLRGWLSWSWSYLWAVWFILVLILIYILRGPLKINESGDEGVLEQAAAYFNSLTPKFYVALTGTSSLVSGIILIFEWWYFKNNNAEPSLELESDTEEISEKMNPVAECKIWRNPMALFRGAEYSRLKNALEVEPLMFHDMNLSAQDHQNFFTAEDDSSRPDYDIMSVAWRERDSSLRISAAKEALKINPDCAAAIVLLAEEDCPTISEAEAMLKRAVRAIESGLPSQGGQLMPPEKFSLDPGQRQGARRRDLNMLMYCRRRLAMCSRKLGKVREAIKMFKEIVREGSISSVFGIQENLIESCLELQAYADLQGLLVRYDDTREPRSAVMSYTSALIKARAVVDKFIFNPAQRKGLSSAEATAIEAMCRAIEFNPHVPLYLLELKPMIIPPEHFLRRGDSEACAYAFTHLQHWKRIDGALDLLRCTWKGEFSEHVSRFQLGGFCYPYSMQIESADRQLLPEWHEISVFPRKESTMWSVFQTLLCLLIVVMAVVIHYYPTSATDIYSTTTLFVKGFYDHSLNNFWSKLPKISASPPKPAL